MKDFLSTSILDTTDSFVLNTFHESALFFDIETTGFSPKHCKIYFIGCSFRTGNHIQVHQFFSESTTDEADVLISFLSLCEKFTTTITFNGLGFDLPFIKERCKQLNLKENLDSMEHIDIFKLLSPYKKFFKLPNMKQKTIEQFLDIQREDLYSGGELINVYDTYINNPTKEGLSLLQLHNKEDVLGMIDILPILSYVNFFNGNYIVTNAEVRTYAEYEGCSSQEVHFTLQTSIPLPKRISFGKDNIYFSGCGHIIKLKVKIYEGELKYFYSNYKDYYYLPKEDIAIHKSVAFYVDKDFRTKAKAATCYSKKTGHFLPQYQDIFSPYFKLDYHDKISYFEMTDEFLNSKENQHQYVSHLLFTLCTK